MRVPVVIAHLKRAGVGNWGRSAEVLAALEQTERRQHVGCDCYPYAASFSTLDLKQVTDACAIQVTWSQPHPHACVVSSMVVDCKVEVDCVAFKR